MVNFTDEQISFIESPIERNIVLLATAGAGKTTALVARYQYMIDHGVNPDTIAAIAFNKSMAEEFKSRILGAIPNLSDRAQNQISTIHAYCFRMLREYGGGTYIMPKAWEEAKLVQEGIDKFWNGKKPTVKETLNYIDTAKYEYVQEKDTDIFFGNRMSSEYANMLSLVMRYYNKNMRSRNWISFADMLYMVEDKINNDPKFSGFAREKTPYILVDEAQDVNAQALRIFLRVGTSIVLVGDSDQLLYRFAGANPDILMKDFIEERSPIVLKLSKNFRSTQKIVDYQRLIIEMNYSEKGGPYDQSLMKNIESTRGDDGEDVRFAEYENPIDEADATITTIMELMEKGVEPDNIFVAARTRSQLGYLESPLVRNNIPFLNLCGGSFWGQSHIQHIVNYIKLALDTTDEEAYQSVANIASNEHVWTWGEKAGEYCGVRFLGREFFKKCPSFGDIQDFLNYNRDSWRYKTKDYFDKKSGFNPYDEYGPSKAEDLLLLVEKIQEFIEFSDSPSSVVEFVFESCYKKYLTDHEGAIELEDSRLEDIETLTNFAAEYGTLDQFLQAVDEMVEKSQAETWDGHVVISTVHRLKGQERSHVFVLGVSEGDGFNKQPCGLLPHTFSLCDPPQLGVLPPGKGNPLEDERCIFFVGASRAKNVLYLSSVKLYNGKTMRPSRFIPV